VNVRVVGAGEAAETLRAALARVGLAERAGEPAAFVCTVDDLSRAIAMRELAQVTGPIVVLTDDAASAIEAGADDAGGTADEVARRVSARIRAPKVSRLEETPMAEPPAASGRRQKPLILVVEDDEDARMVLTELLRPRYDVDAVGDGETALKRAAELNPDLVLLDLFLPGMDGFGALTGLRRNSKTADTPSIAPSSSPRRRSTSARSPRRTASPACPTSGPSTLAWRRRSHGPTATVTPWRARWSTSTG